MKKKDIDIILRIGKYGCFMWPLFIIVDKPCKKFQITRHEVQSAQGLKTPYTFPLIDREAFKEWDDGFTRFLEKILPEKAGIKLEFSKTTTRKPVRFQDVKLKIELTYKCGGYIKMRKESVPIIRIPLWPQKSYRIMIPITKLNRLQGFGSSLDGAPW